MRSRWNPRALHGASPLEQLVYRSRLIGEEETLGLFGGGNTSLKGTMPDVLGEPEEALWVKGSGADLKDCQPRHFAPLRLKPLQRLTTRRAMIPPPLCGCPPNGGRLPIRDRQASALRRPQRGGGMSDEEMVAFLERCLIDPKSPRPSIETLLHAFIPEVAIDHTHADAILALANTRQGQSLVREVLGEELLWIPYLQPGFALSRRVVEAYQRHPDAHGAVLEQHGLITWGPDGKTSYLRTIRYVSMAERFLAQQHRRRSWSAVGCATLPEHRRLEVLRHWLPAIRRTISRERKMCVTYTDTPKVLAFVNARRMPEVARIGPATPDHMLRTKRLPFIVELGRRSTEKLAPEDVVKQLERYAAAHRRYFLTYRHPGPAAGGGTMQDPYPRVMLIPGVGMLTTGKDATESTKVARIYTHAMAIMRDASTVGHYTSVSPREAFGVEYWPLELYKLSLAPPEAELSRVICLITGAAGGIGRAIAKRLVERGACVVVTDLDGAAMKALAQELNQLTARRCALGLAMDVTHEQSIRHACDETLKLFGGLDALVSNAGIAAVASIHRLPRLEWDRSLLVNATGHFLMARTVIPWLRAQGLGGALVFIASKNVLAPGKEFGAYSAAKAAETQLARVLAIENGEAGIRVNIVNPDGVFQGSGLWKTIGAERAKTYGLHADELERYYQQRNLLKVRVLPEDVAEAVCFLVSPRAAKTTGCILTVDGGLREAFPR